MRHRQQFTICVLLTSLFLIPSLALGSFSLSQVPRSIPLKNDYYAIQNVQRAGEPGILRFEISSAHSLYTVEGFLPLVKTLKEIEIIERVKAQDREGFFSGAKDSVGATASGLGNLVVHPVNSAKGLGKAAGKLGRSMGGMFSKKEEGEKSSFGEKLTGGGQRETARKIGADVYTRNPHLKNLINEISNARLGGRGAVMVISFLIPVAAIATIAMSAGTINSAADQIVNDKDRTELYKLNKQALAIMGFKNDDIIRFLGRTELTPREQTYFRFYLDAFKSIEGSGTVFEGMLNARSGWEVFRRLYEAQMAAGADYNKFARIWSYPEGIAVLELSGRMIFFTAYDELDTDDLGKKVLVRMQFLRSKNQVPIEIRNGGFITDDFRAQAHRQKVSVKPWCFFDTKEIHDKV